MPVCVLLVRETYSWLADRLFLAEAQRFDPIYGGAESVCIHMPPWQPWQCIYGVQDLAPGHCCCCYCCGCCCRIVGQFVTQDPGKLLLWFYLLIFVVRVILPYCHCVVIDQLGGYLFLMYLVEFYAMLTSSDYGLGPLRECWQWPSSDGHHSGAKRDLQL